MSNVTHRAAPPSRAGSPFVVGVTARSGAADWVAHNTHNYLMRLAELGATAVVLAPDAPACLPRGATYHPDAEGRLPDAVLDDLDGLILAGGGDVDPRHFGQPLAGADPASIDAPRNALELALGRAALARDLPLFGICRGCQVLNVAAGGVMVQHIDGHRAPLDAPWLHDVPVTPGSRLAALLGTATLAVNTYHHQGVDRRTLAPLFMPAAYDAQQGWLIEAYESPRHRWVVGVQWHPERSFELPAAHQRLWESFADACRRQDGRP
jgi:putative glutamine amidotransferase